MSRWLIWCLLLTFAVHLAVFARLYQRRRRVEHAAASVTFLFLMIASGLRLLPEQPHLLGVDIYWLPRVAGWISGALSVYLMLRRRRRVGSARLGPKLAPPGATR